MSALAEIQIPGEEKPRGYCWCGCGGQTPPAKTHGPRTQTYKGVPNRYLAGHQNRSSLSLQNYVVNEHGCWIWQGQLTNGYGRVKISGRKKSAHRVLWEKANGRPVPPGLQMDHLCRVTECVNPDHVEPVTSQENIRRRDQARGKGVYATSCSRGHLFDAKNTRDSADGRRVCRTCRRLEAANRRAKA